MDAWASPVYSAAQALRAGGARAARAALLAARARTELLSHAYEDALGPALTVPMHPGLNPPLWELGHVGWFQEWWIGRNAQRARGVRFEEHARSASLVPRADELYDSSRVAHAARWDLPLPPLAATRDYLFSVLAQCLALLDALPDDAGEDALYFFRLCALHEEMHAEAAVYMARGLGIALPPEVLRPISHPRPAGTIRVPAQVFRAGAPATGFAFDNELGAHDVPLAAFEIDASPVTWARYMHFVEAGGYRQAKWWDDAGMRWLAGVGSPQRVDDIARRAQDPAAAAVHLTAHEARAWCQWAGRRLPTEVEWECAALTQPGFAWGEVWEWTASRFEPYPGFVPHPYRDYSAPWFGTRMVLRGAGPATSASLAHPRYRNFFEPHRDDVHTGFRSAL